MTCLFKNKIAFLLLLCIPVYGHTLSNDHEQPVHIQADKVIIDKQKGITRYRGNVRFTQGSLIIRGSSVLLYYDNGQLDKVIISGKPASFQQTPAKGEVSVVSSSGRMEYLARQSRLLLFDDARVSQGKNVFSGEMIEYDIVKGTVVANREAPEGSRINAILDEPPQSPHKTP